MRQSVKLFKKFYSLNRLRGIKVELGSILYSNLYKFKFWYLGLSMHFCHTYDNLSWAWHPVIFMTQRGRSKMHGLIPHGGTENWMSHYYLTNLFIYNNAY